MTIIAPKSLAVIKIHGMIVHNGDRDVLLFNDMYKLFMAIKLVGTTVVLYLILYAMIMNNTLKFAFTVKIIMIWEYYNNKIINIILHDHVLLLFLLIKIVNSSE